MTPVTLVISPTVRSVCELLRGRRGKQVRAPSCDGVSGPGGVPGPVHEPQRGVGHRLFPSQSHVSQG